MSSETSRPSRRSRFGTTLIYAGAFVCFVVLGLTAAYFQRQGHTLESLLPGEHVAAPRVSFDEDGGASSKFAVDNSPTLTQWINGRTFATCRVGYHFETSVRRTSLGVEYHEATCEPNPIPRPSRIP